MVNKCSFVICVAPCFIFAFEFLCSLLISLFTMPPKYSSKVFSSVSKYKEDVMCLMEDVSMLHMFIQAWIGHGFSQLYVCVCARALVCVKYIYI